MELCDRNKEVNFGQCDANDRIPTSETLNPNKLADYCHRKVHLPHAINHRMRNNIAHKWKIKVARHLLLNSDKQLRVRSGHRRIPTINDIEQDLKIQQNWWTSSDWVDRILYFCLLQVGFCLRTNKNREHCAIRRALCSMLAWVYMSERWRRILEPTNTGKLTPKER